MGASSVAVSFKSDTTTPCRPSQPIPVERGHRGTKKRRPRERGNREGGRKESRQTMRGEPERGGIHTHTQHLHPHTWESPSVGGVCLVCACVCVWVWAWVCRCDLLTVCRGWVCPGPSAACLWGCGGGVARTDPRRRACKALRRLRMSRGYMGHPPTVRRLTGRGAARTPPLAKHGDARGVSPYHAVPNKPGS